MKKQLLEELFKLTQQQAVAIAEKDISIFEGLIEQKQHLMTKIEEADVVVNEKEKNECKEVLKKIIALDTENRKVFDALLEETKQQLKNMRGAQKMNNTYGSHYDRSIEEGIFIDKR